MRAASENAEKTPLEERLITLIEANGPITVADYMADALGHPHDGYYASRDAIGADGDFTTAPEISQIFGELIGLWLVQTWIDMGEPARFNLIELGPGRGVLMADIVRAAALRPEFLKAAQILLVESSGRLRHEQQRRLRNISPFVDWLDALDDAPEGPALIIGNEFFDCLPIRQFEKVENGWRERLISVSDGALAFTLALTPPPPELELPAPETADKGDIYELCEDRDVLCDQIARIVKADKGRALIIDYGRVKSGVGETLQAVRDHEYWPVLASPGYADITAHVDFDALARRAIEAGAGVFGPAQQGAFLERLGLALRVQRLCAGKTPKEQADIHAAAHRLASPSQMGEIFKALCISSPDLAPPPGF
ncbi:MAG: SAM-dependent methyltransferase [Pseudomonadota bacterium]